MKFQENAKPIYLQIADRICDEVSSGTYSQNGRIPSVREYAALLKVNVNTVMRTFDYLASNDIIYNKRGQGYFIADDALAKIEEMRNRTFYTEDLAYIFARLKVMGITPDGLSELYSKFLNSES